jgi:hypothetical protein
VTLNDRIDFFGQDVNIAARVQGLADVNEVCISATVMEAPGVADIVKSRSVSRKYENLRGIGQQIGRPSHQSRSDADINDQPRAAFLLSGIPDRGRMPHAGSENGRSSPRTGGSRCTGVQSDLDGDLLAGSRRLAAPLFFVRGMRLQRKGRRKSPRSGLKKTR